MMDNYQDVSSGLTNQILLGVTSGLSVIGSLVVISTYIIYKEIRSVSRHIILCISISDLLVTLFNCLSIAIKPDFDRPEIYIITCKIQSFISTTAVLASFLWTMVLAIYLYCVIVRESKRLGKKIVWPWAHLFCWLLPLIINLTALFLGKLGNSGDRNTSGWCWINVFSDQLNDAKIWMLIDGKGMEIVTYVVIIVIYIRIKHFVHTKMSKKKKSPDASTHLLENHAIEAARSIDRKLLLIPLLFVLMRIWGTIRYFIFLQTTEWKPKKDLNKVEKILIYLQTVGDNLQGAVNCILFCVISPVVRKRIRQSFSSFRRDKFHLHDSLHDEEISSPFSPS